jgi:acylphosphatase
VSETVRRRVVVHGYVQGVFFRDSARRKALGLGVAGWVRNCPDGTVEAMAEGSPDSVASFVDWCRHGPRGAEVARVVESSETPEGLSGFQVR